MEEAVRDAEPLSSGSAATDVTNPQNKSREFSSLDFGVRQRKLSGNKGRRRGGGGGRGGGGRGGGRGRKYQFLDPLVLRQRLCKAEENTQVLLEFAYLLVTENKALKKVLTEAGVQFTVDSGVKESLALVHKVPQLQTVECYPENSTSTAVSVTSCVRRLAELTFTSSRMTSHDKHGVSTAEPSGSEQQPTDKEEGEEEEKDEGEGEDIAPDSKAHYRRPRNSSAPHATLPRARHRRAGSTPRFYKQDLLVIIQERNFLKRRVLELEEQLQMANETPGDTGDSLCALPPRTLPRGTNVVVQPEDYYITDVTVVGYKRRGRNSVYVIHTTWSDRNRFELYRRYGEFFTFQNTLQQLFPEEAGRTRNKPRVLPTLPTVDNLLSVLGRTNLTSVLKSRLVTINDYCQFLLLRMDAKVSRSTHVVNFFKPNIGDKQLERLERPSGDGALVLSVCPLEVPAGSNFEEYTVLADYHSTGQTEISASAGDTVKVITKDEKSGWWLVQKLPCGDETKTTVGYIPGSFLRARDLLSTVELQRECLGFVSSIIPEEADSPLIQKYTAIEDYFPDDSRQVSFSRGDVLIVVEKSEDGWWLVAHNGSEGWVPASYLEPVMGQELETQEADNAITEPVQRYTARKAYTAEMEDEVSFPKGAVVDVLEKSLSGWWTIRYNGKVGVAPSSVLSMQHGLYVSHRSTMAISHTASGIAQPPPRRESIMIMGKRKVPSIPERVPSPMSANSCGWVGNGPEISGSRRDTEGELFLRSTATGAVGSLGRESLGSHFKTIASSGFPKPQSAPGKDGGRTTNVRLAVQQFQNRMDGNCGQACSLADRKK